MKRRGQTAVSSETSGVISPPFPQRKNDMVEASSFSVLSPFSSTTSRTWEETRDAMDKLLLQFEGPNASNDTVVLKDVTNGIKSLHENVDTLKSKSSKIKDEIKTRIQISSGHLDEESEALKLQQERLKEKHTEIEKIKYEIAVLVKKEMELKVKIDQYKQDAFEDIGQIDEVEEEKKQDVFRLQQHISLLAMVSGIKWDYDCVDSIAGEIEIKSKNKHVRFEIDEDKHSPFEIANMLWDTISSGNDSFLRA